MKTIEMLREGSLFYSIAETKCYKTAPRKYLGKECNFVKFVNEGNAIKYIIGEENGIKLGIEIYQKAKSDPQFIQKIKNDWINAKLEATKISKQLLKKSPANLTNNEINDDIQTYYAAYFKVWEVGGLFNLSDYASSIVLNEQLKNNQIVLNPDEFSAILESPYETYITKNHQKLLLMACEIVKKLKEKTISEVITIIENDQQLKGEMNDLIENYYWINMSLSDYNYKPADQEYFAKKIIEIIHSYDPPKKLAEIKEKTLELKNRKEKLLSSLNNKELSTIVEMIDLTSQLRDERIELLFLMAFPLGKYFSEISNRTGLSTVLIECVFPDEFEQLLNQKINKDELEKRKSFTVIDFDQDPYYVYIGLKAKKFIDEELKQEYTESDEFFGNTAATGSASGIVRLVFSMDEINQLKKGEILVTGMTTPEFVPAMEKAAGIITDEGGVTCHAAIISRELRRPCIVGTRVATKILKDGDFIEMNASIGRVKRIKKGM